MTTQLSSQASPQIDIIGASRSRSLQKLMERRLRRWLAGFAAGIEGMPRVLVRIDAEGEGSPFVSCQVELRMAGRSWTASWYGRNPAQALGYCLQHMVERQGPVPASA